MIVPAKIQEYVKEQGQVHPLIDIGYRRAEVGVGVEGYAVWQHSQNVHYQRQLDRIVELGDGSVWVPKPTTLSLQPLLFSELPIISLGGSSKDCRR